jgi:hypothetical protein
MRSPKSKAVVDLIGFAIAFSIDSQALPQILSKRRQDGNRIYRDADSPDVRNTGFVTVEVAEARRGSDLAMDTARAGRVCRAHLLL